MNYVYEIKIKGVRRYVGLTKDLKRRSYQHNYNLRRGKSKELYNNAREAGLDTLKLNIIYSNKSRVECKRFECLLILEDHFSAQDLYQKPPSISDR